MENKERFEEILAELIEFAAANENKLTKEDINDYFIHMDLDDEKMQLLYAYFMKSGILVEGYESGAEGHLESAVINKDMTVEDELSKQTMDFYLEELKDLPVYTIEEKIHLLEMLQSDQEQAKQKLIEAYLREVIHIAKQHQNQGIPLGDLIQEGNMGLVFGVDSFAAGDIEQFEVNIKKTIQSSMIEALKEQNSTYQAADKLAKKANQLSEASKKLADELGREATVEELAECVGTTVEDIKDIMKVSLDAISLKTAN